MDIIIRVFLLAIVKGILGRGIDAVADVLSGEKERRLLQTPVDVDEKLGDIFYQMSAEEREYLAEILDCTPDYSALLQNFGIAARRALRLSPELTISYRDLLIKVQANLCIPHGYFTTVKYMERQIVQRILEVTWQRMSEMERAEFSDGIKDIVGDDFYPRNGTSYGSAAAVFVALTAARQAGFSLYSGASTILYLLGGAMNITFPFAAYMMMSKAIAVAIGPIGWCLSGGLTIATLWKSQSQKEAWSRVLATVLMCIDVNERIAPSYRPSFVVRSSHFATAGIIGILIIVGMWIIPTFKQQPPPAPLATPRPALLTPAEPPLLNPSKEEAPTYPPIYSTLTVDKESSTAASTDTFPAAKPPPVSSPNILSTKKSTTKEAPSEDILLTGEHYPQTRQRILGAPEVSRMSYAQARYALNEIYARHGFPFASRPIRQQFSQFDWYHPVEGQTMLDTESQLSVIERKNLLQLAAHRNR